MGFSSKLLFGGLVAGAALAVYVHKRHVDRGESYADILMELPTTARRAADNVKRRATLALDEGKAAARAREDEFVREIGAVSTGADQPARPFSS